MKKVLAITIVILSSISFVFGSNESQEQNDGKVINMDKAMFIKDIFDYTANTDTWKYIGNKPAIIDFYASWCAPCRQISPILDALAKEYKDDIYIYKIDTDKEKELAKAFGITALPTLLFVPLEGQPIMTKGAMQKPEFERAIKEYILKTNDK